MPCQEKDRYLTTLRGSIGEVFGFFLNGGRRMNESEIFKDGREGEKFKLFMMKPVASY